MCTDIYYRPQRSCEGYVFTGMCLSTGGLSAPRGGGCLLWGGACSRGVPTPRGVCLGGVCLGGVCSRGCLLRGVSVLGVSVCSGGVSALGGVCSALRQPPQRDGYCCRQYASYWNAFLFTMLLCSLTSLTMLDTIKFIGYLGCHIYR